MLTLLTRDDVALFHRMEDIGVTGIIHAPWLLAQPTAGQAPRDARTDAARRFAGQFTS